MCGVDYITATAKRLAGREAFRVHAAQLSELERLAGNEGKPWAWQGYSGFTAGSITYGERDDGAIMRLSSNLAQMYWRPVVATATNVSRMDLQVTVNYKPFPKHLGRDGYVAVLASVGPQGHIPNAMLTVATDGGETLNLGKRASDKYARLYNKDAESDMPQYRNCWRYELELKNRPAWAAAQQLAMASDERPHVAVYVWRHFADRQVLPTFSPELGGGLITVPRPRSNDERALIWLATQVRSVVDRLTAHGRRTETQNALGL